MPKEFFFIIGDGLIMKATRVFSSSSAKKKNPETKGTVILCTIEKGKVVVGEKIEMKISSGHGLTDKVARIEVNKKPLHFGVSGQKVGICLAETSAETIEAFLN